jgi:hypothetical protein
MLFVHRWRINEHHSGGINMLKIASVCAALILAGAAFSTSAEARFGGHGGVGGFGGHGGSFGGHVGSFGGHVGGLSGARMGSFTGARMGSFSGARMGTFSGARMGTFTGARIGAVPYSGARVATTYGGRGFYRGGYIGTGRYASGYRYGRHGYRYGRYWPWGVGVGALAVASAWPYYSDYYYGDYGYDDCFQLRRVWTRYGWRWAQVNVCGYSGYNYQY